MARPLRVTPAGGIHHVVARGNAKQDIYLDDQDRRSFLGILRDALAVFDWRCLTYCLMPNHYHLVTLTMGSNLSEGMKRINSVYAQRFNRRYDRCGHLFQGRFGATLIESDTHMLEVLRYVALNPVRAGLTAGPDEWEWSGHREIVGLAEARHVSLRDVLVPFGRPTNAALSRYRDFVDAGVSQRSLRV
jgi:REP-associated tyrosine transposase